MDAARALGSSLAAKRFELLKELGTGGFGTVWEARDRERGERIALKALSRIAPDAVFRFKQEFRAAQDLAHPNLVRLGELFQLDGGWFFSMEIVDGSDFCDYVRPGGAPDFARLRKTVLQVLHGLGALHAAGLVHRDIKPCNVRVTPEGRVVILDFGMSTRWTGSGLSTQVPGGTAAYMAPEQAFSSPVGPAADLYAVGAMLYEALTGEVPFDGSPLRVLLDKQAQRPPSPTSRVPGIPPELDLLCMQLLDVNPAARPTLEQSRCALGFGSDEGTAQVGSRHPGGAHAGALPCLGRALELKALQAALASARRGATQMVLLQGESGLGKSALLAHFIEGVRAEDDGTVILVGRCHEHENVAYKGFDGLVDALARYLRRLGEGECEALLPPQAALLPRVFPVLGRVPAIVGKRLAGAAPDGALLKRQAFDALFQLLTRVAVRRPLLIAIDDAHFSDLESLRMLGEHFGGDGVFSCLIVVTVRPLAELDPELRSAIDSLGRAVRTTQLPLGRLSDADSHQVLRNVLGDTLADGVAEVLVRESGGHPMLLLALAQHAQSHPTFLAGGVDLQAVLQSRLSELGENARALLDAVAVAGVALARNALSVVTGLTPTDVSAGLAELRAARLLKTDRQGGSECFHAELRAIAVGALGPAEKRALHRLLASAIAQRPGCDAAVVAGHWVLAGEPERAVPTLLSAADQALVALEFERAASLYQAALEHGGLLVGRDRWGVRVQYAHALSGAGACEGAAREYLTCAEAAEPEESRELRRRAVHQLLRGLRVDEGLQVADGLLRELGLSVARHASQAALSLSWQRTRLRLRGLGFRARSVDDVPPELQRELDLHYSLETALRRADPVLGATLLTAFVRRALDGGSTVQVLVALAAEAELLSEVEVTPQPRTTAVLASLESLGAQGSDDYARARIALARGTVFWMRFDLRAAADTLSRADALFGERCGDAQGERAQAQCQFLSACLLQGHLARHAQSSQRWLDEARSRRDAAAQLDLAMVGQAYHRHLLHDDPGAALAELEAALSTWPVGGFSVNHLGALIGRIAILRYRDPRGTAPEAVRLVDEAWPALEADGLLKPGHLAVSLHELRARVRLGLAATLEGGRRRAALGLVARDIAAVRARRSTVYDGVALELSAELSWLSGQAELAVRTLREALAACDEAGLGRHTQAARYLLGSLVEGDEGRLLAETALGWARREGVVNSARYFAFLDVVAGASGLAG